jgi:hypothetical protein
MAGGIGLLLTYGREYLADTAFALTQKVNYFEAGWLAKDFQNFCLIMSYVHGALLVYMTIQSYMH